MQILNVAEKPSAAEGISSILSNGNYKKKRGLSKYNPIYEFPYTYHNQKYQMVFLSLLGHLMETEFTFEYRKWNDCDPAALFTAPIVKSVRKDETSRNIAKSIEIEARKSQYLMLWLDCDREGENIAFEVIDIAKKSNPRLTVFRPRYSSITASQIHNAIQIAGPPNPNLALAVDARSEIDLRCGAAFTRFQTMRIQNKFPSILHEIDNNSSNSNNTNENKVVSYGPCQFPTLGFVVDQFLLLRNFKPEKYYTIQVFWSPRHVTEQNFEHLNEVRSSKDNATEIIFHWDRNRLYDWLACFTLYEKMFLSSTSNEDPVNNGPVLPFAKVIDSRNSVVKKYKPFPLATVELQKRAARWLKMPSEKTMKIAESLYNRGIISYPRTETENFDKKATNFFDLLKSHEGHPAWGRYVTENLINTTHQSLGSNFDYPRSGKKDDHAHPPIHPTKCVTDFSNEEEKKLYELIVLHFLACCSKDATGNQSKVTIAVGQDVDKLQGGPDHEFETFHTTGLVIEAKNYLLIYKYEKWNNKELPDLTSILKNNNGIFVPSKILFIENQTTPPLLLSESDLITKMDKNGIGTDATIAEHIKTIQKRRYVEKVYCNNDGNNNRVARFKPLPLGLALVQTYHSMGHELAKPYLRAQMEQDCADISRGVKTKLQVVRRCLTEMEDIFRSIYSNAVVLDNALGEFFKDAKKAYNAPILIDMTEDDDEYIDEQPSNRNRIFDHENRSTRSDDSVLGPFSSANNNNITILCDTHNLPCIEQIVKKEGPNKGSIFYSCRLPIADKCNYFKWKENHSNGFASNNIGSVIHNVHCTGHNLLAIIRTTMKSGPNQGRKFFKCSLSREECCDFFQWHDG